MAITAISRDFGALDPNIVRIVTTDTLATVIANGYLTTQLANIAAIQNGVFQWKSDDFVLISYSGGEGYFLFDAVNLTFIPQGVLNAQVRLTSAQILGMYATPVQIIPAPGANKFVVLGRSVFSYIFGTTQYAAGGAIGLEFGNVAHGAGQAASNTLAAATFNGYAASNTFELTPVNANVTANVVNLGIYLSNATGAFTTGDGSLVVSVDYRIMPTV